MHTFFLFGALLFTYFKGTEEAEFCPEVYLVIFINDFPSRRLDLVTGMFLWPEERYQILCIFYNVDARANQGI